ncbi:MAG: RNA polymerase sigma factor [Muribaculaceae bacterium]
MMEKSRIEMLFRQYYARMYVLARTLLYDDDECRDVVSDIFAKVYEGDITLTPPTEGSYLLAAVRNRCLNIIEQKHTRCRLRCLYALEADSASMECDDERYDEVMAFVGSHFSGTALRVLQLRFVDGLECKEIASTLQISTVAVYRHLARAIETIKANIKHL